VWAEHSFGKLNQAVYIKTTALLRVKLTGKNLITVTKLELNTVDKRN
jgi:hypothetical protein